ncbi:ribonuclease HII [Kineococcus gynurae]|uniref:Ribonuclease HII n=1 Tax=Kineococcus gynurae TaxID=452979 RepID=A0ABV5LVU5_9ACTN
MPPTLRVEKALLRERGVALLAGMDEVGRGALAGPVTVGVLLVAASTRTAPTGLRDSKLLSPQVREQLAPKVRRWAVASAVGHAEPDEIDSVGIISALRLAGRRALAQLTQQPDVVLLDGNHDWLSDPRDPSLFDLVDGGPPVPVLPCAAPPVTTRVKADLTCAAVAGASVLAKTTRDAIMIERAAEHPLYGWEGNKGYSAPEHLQALSRHGTSAQHRRSWRLPGVLPGISPEVPTGLPPVVGSDLLLPPAVELPAP